MRKSQRVKKRRIQEHRGKEGSFRGLKGIQKGGGGQWISKGAKRGRERVCVWTRDGEDVLECEGLITVEIDT